MPHLTQRKLDVMRRRAQDVQDQASEATRQRERAELMATQTGRMMAAIASTLLIAAKIRERSAGERAEDELSPAPLMLRTENTP